MAVVKHKRTLFVLVILLVSTYVILYQNVFESSEVRGVKVSTVRHLLSRRKHSPLTKLQHKRISHLRQVCADRDLFTNRLYRGNESFTFYYSEHYNFAYCKVPKSGCTYWTQLFLILNNTSTNEVFGLQRASVHSLGKELYMTKEDLVSKNPPVILVSRDPYSRLYSAYIDKVFLGFDVSLRKEIRTNDKKCNFDISFKEFLRFILTTAKSNGTLDPHWAPIYSLCMPCEVNQYKIVKQETFSSDVESILDELEIDPKKYEEVTDALHENRVAATIPGIIETAYKRNGNRAEVLECIGWSEIARRLWRSFKIQGYLHKNASFPKNTLKQVNGTVNYISLTNATLRSTKHFPLTIEESKRQRRQALVSAYKGISKDIIAGIRQLYRPDFRLFDYDENPPKK